MHIYIQDYTYTFPLHIIYVYKSKAHEFRWAHAAAMEACRRQKLRDPKDPGLRESRDHHPWLGPRRGLGF